MTQNLVVEWDLGGVDLPWKYTLKEAVSGLWFERNISSMTECRGPRFLSDGANGTTQSQRVAGSDPTMALEKAKDFR